MTGLPKTKHQVLSTSQSPRIQQVLHQQLQAPPISKFYLTSFTEDSQDSQEPCHSQLHSRQRVEMG